jgi:hypothetical protein
LTIKAEVAGERSDFIPEALRIGLDAIGLGGEHDDDRV